VVTGSVGAGFVLSRARASGNVTGFSTFEAEIGGKWLELLTRRPFLEQSVGDFFDDFLRWFHGSANPLESGPCFSRKHSPSFSIVSQTASCARSSPGGC
jgi:hypothetical protein